MTIWAVGPVNGEARAFIQSSNPADILGQMKEGETLSPIPGNLDQDVVIILRENMQYNIQE